MIVRESFHDSVVCGRIVSARVDRLWRKSEQISFHCSPRLTTARSREFAFAVDFDIDAAVGVGLNLYPDTAGGDYLGGKIVLAFVGHALEENTVRASELGDDDALDAVDDECAVRGHPREVGEENLLLFLVAGRFDLEAHHHAKRRFIGLHRALGILLVPTQITEGELDEL